jgi:hypothetical protein
MFRVDGDWTESVVEDGIVCRYVTFCLDWFYFLSFSLLGMEMGRNDVGSECRCSMCL